MLCCTLDVYRESLNECVKFEFNDVKSLYTKNDSEQRRSVSI